MEISLKEEQINNLALFPTEVIQNITKLKLDAVKGTPINADIVKLIEQMVNLKSLCIDNGWGGSNIPLLMQYPTSLQELEIRDSCQYNDEVNKLLFNLVNLETLKLNVLCNVKISTNWSNLKHLEIHDYIDYKNITPIYKLTNLETIIFNNPYPVCNYIPDHAFSDAILDVVYILGYDKPKYYKKEFEMLWKIVHRLKQPKPWRYQIDRRIINLSKLKVLRFINCCVENVHEDVTKLQHLQELTIENDCDCKMNIPDNVKNMKQLKLI